MMSLDIVRSKPKPIRAPKADKKPVVKVSSRGSLIAKAHAIMREIVLDRDLRCVCPAPENGHSPVLQAGHLIASTKGSVRFDLLNVHCQCKSCNRRHVDAPQYYLHWFLEVFGQKEFDRIYQDSNIVKPMKLYELEELIVQLKEIRHKQVADMLQGIPYKPYFTQTEILSGAWRLK